MSKKGYRIGVWTLLIVILGIAFVTWHWYDNGKDVLTQNTETPKSQSFSVSKPNIVDVEKLGRDSDIASLIKDRKTDYGLSDEVDLIITPDESLKIGGTVIPMEEILSKIRIKEGVLEDAQRKPGGKTDWKVLLKEKTDQFNLIENKLKISDSELSQIDREKLIAERDRLAGLMAIQDRYQEIKRLISSKSDALTQASPKAAKSLKAEIRSLKQQEKKLQDEIKNQLGIPQHQKAYGIYIVKPGDNIWDIHFRLLRSFFRKKGVTVNSTADEPISKGKSSGVGRVLKFSEKMVYIYNIRNQSLDQDLDLIEPQSKIVVFNMGEVFALLEQIDFTHIQEVRYDGNTLWIPPKS